LIKTPHTPVKFGILGGGAIGEHALAGFAYIKNAYKKKKLIQN
jgi:hypothetical protein